MVDTDKKLEPKVFPLIFKDGDKNGPLEEVIIRTGVYESRQYIIYFGQKGGRVYVRKVDPIGEYIPPDDSNRVPGCLFNPAIDQARAIFADYGRKHLKTKVPVSQGQARLL